LTVPILHTERVVVILGDDSRLPVERSQVHDLEIYAVGHFRVLDWPDCEHCAVKQGDMAIDEPTGEATTGTDPGPIACVAND
jgi:hypothetical protein